MDLNELADEELQARIYELRERRASRDTYDLCQYHYDQLRAFEGEVERRVNMYLGDADSLDFTFG